MHISSKRHLSDQYFLPLKCKPVLSDTLCRYSFRIMHFKFQDNVFLTKLHQHGPAGCTVHTAQIDRCGIQEIDAFFHLAQPDSL